MTDQPGPSPALQQRLHAALRAHGDGDTDYGDQTAAVLTALAPELAELADYRNRITWETTCAACTRVLDSAYQETTRREEAEADLNRVRDFTAQLEGLAATAAKVPDRALYAALARRLRAALDGTSTSGRPISPAAGEDGVG